MKLIQVIIAVVFALPALSVASLEEQLKLDLQNHIRLSSGRPELRFDNETGAAMIDSLVDSLKKTDPSMLSNPADGDPSIERFDSVFRRFMELPKDRRTDFRYYLEKEERKELNQNQRILLFRFMLRELNKYEN